MTWTEDFRRRFKGETKYIGRKGHRVRVGPENVPVGHGEGG